MNTDIFTKRVPAFREGYNAFFRNRHWSNNYEPGSFYDQEFRHGADVAYFDNLRKIEAK